MRNPSRRSLSLILLMLAGLSRAATTISVTTIGAPGITQDFNTLPSTVLTPVSQNAQLIHLGSGFTNNMNFTGLDGWYFSSAANAMNAFWGVGPGDLNHGSTYSFGVQGTNPVTDRALGSLASNTNSQLPRLGAIFTNNTGQTLTGFIITYRQEQWRVGEPDGTDTLQFNYQLGGTSIDGPGTFVSVPSLNCTTLVNSGNNIPLDGNAAANNAMRSGTVLNLNWPPGGTLVIRWEDINDLSGADEANAIDDFNILFLDNSAINVTWNTTSGAWDTSSPNWIGGNPAPNLYKDSQSPIFGNISADSTIAVQPAGVYPGPATLSHAQNTYTFVGGPINGSASLLKSGPGSVIFAAVNGYAGGTTISGGVLESQVNGSLGTGTVTLADATLRYSVNNQALPPSLLLSGTSATLDIPTGITVTQASTGTSFLNGTPGYKLIKTGGGTLLLTEAGKQLRNFSGTSSILDIQQGIIRPATGNFIGPQVINIAAGATLDDSYDDGDGIGFLTGAGLFIMRANSPNGACEIRNNGVQQTGTFSGLITCGTNGVIGATSVERNSNSALRLTGNENLTLTNPANNFAGQIEVYAGRLIFNSIADRGVSCSVGDGNFNPIPSEDFALGNVGSGGTLSYTGPTASTNRTILLRNDSNFNGLNSVVEVTNASTVLTLTGVINQTALATFAKNGSGSLVFDANNTYTGGTSVNAGILQLNVGRTLSSAVSVSAGAQFILNGALTGTVSLASTTFTASQLRGTGSVSGAIVGVSNTNGKIWPGVASVVQDLTSNETLTAGSANLSNSGKLSVIMRNTLHVNQKLNLTGALTISDSTSILSLAYEPNMGTSSFTVIKAGSVGGTRSFASVLPASGYNTAYKIVYKAGGAVVAGGDGPARGVTLPAYDEVVVAFLNNNVTPVTIVDFNALPEGAGVRLAWNALSEFQNAGFNIYRRDVDAANWTRINDTLIPGRLTNPEPKVYMFYDWPPCGRYEYKLEPIELEGHAETTMLSPIVTIDSEFISSNADCTVETLDAIGAYDAVHSSACTAALVEKRFAAAVSLQRPGMQVPLARSIASAVTPIHSQPKAAARWFSAAHTNAPASRDSVKVLYTQPGVMLIPQSSLPAGFDISRLSVRREDRLISPLALTPRGLLLYGPGYSDDYTDKDALFLFRSSAPTAANTISAPPEVTGLFASALPLSDTTSATALAEFHDVYFDYNYRPYNFPPWFSNKYLAANSTQTFTLNTPHAANAAAQLTVNLWSLTEDDAVNPDHALQVQVNGVPVGEARWDGGCKMLSFAFELPNGLLAEDNSIELTTSDLGSPAGQLSFLHSLRIDYTRTLDASDTVEIIHTGNESRLFELCNVPAAGVWIVDLRFSDRPALVPAESQSDASRHIRFRAAPGGSGKYLIVPVGKELSPLSISARRVQPPRLNAQYVATGPAQFQIALQPLLLARSREGLRSIFVDQEQLFNCYNFGRYGPAAIQKAARIIRPQYLLLAGRTTYDYHNYSGQNIDPLCPAFLVPTSFWSQTTSDALFGDLGRGYPEIAVGRLPANNVAEMNVAVSRILSYSPPSSSGARAHAVADIPDPIAGDFPQQADSLIQATLSATWQRNFVGSTSRDALAAREALRSAANGGADWLLYVGHGNSIHLGSGTTAILDTNALQDWRGNAILLQSTCTAAWMAKDSQNFRSLATQGLTQPQGGIAASIGSSTYVQAPCSTDFMRELLKQTSQPGARWGGALMRAQQWSLRQSGSVFYRDLGRTEQLFGDPAMRVFAKDSVPAGAKQSSDF